MPGLYQSPLNVNTEKEDMRQAMMQRKKMEALEAMKGSGANMESKGLFAAFVVLRKDLPALLKGWAANATMEEQKEHLLALAEVDVPANHRIWGLSSSEGLATGGGFYMAAPKPVQAIIMLEPVDGKLNSAHHIAVDPQAPISQASDMVSDWIQSLAPKKTSIQNPRELALYGLEATVKAFTRPEVNGGAVISKGL